MRSRLFIPNPAKPSHAIRLRSRHRANYFVSRLNPVRVSLP
jgi:hypothetical protein